MTAPILLAQGVGHDFGPLPVLDHIDLSLAPGELLCLLGPSGCGKSTLLSCLGGLAVPGRGTLISRAAQPAFMFQDPVLLPWRDALDNATFGLRGRGISRRDRRASGAAWLTRLGLAVADGGKYPHHLSGGMRQRVALARALAIEPDLLLLDEPFAALDLGLRRQMQDLLRDQIDRAGLSAVLVTHDVVEAVRLADRLVVLSARPARVVADLPNQPGTDAVHERVAAFLRHPGIADALNHVSEQEA